MSRTAFRLISFAVVVGIALIGQNLISSVETR
jgi:hypothetical protein